MEFKLLLKRAFRSIFHNKLFVALMSILIFISSATYTTFESAASTFESSYDTLVSDGNLHDAVVKENFQSNVAITISGQDVYNISDTDLENTYAQSTAVSNRYSIELENSHDLETKSIVFDVSNNNWSASLLDIIDEVDIWQTEKESQAKDEQASNFVEGLNTLYSNELKAEERKSLSVTAGVNAYKVIEYDQDSEINKIHMYEGSSDISDSLTDQTMVDGIASVYNDMLYSNAIRINPNPTPADIQAIESDYVSTIQELENKGYSVNTTKGFKYSYNMALFSGSFVDPSSFEAIISPSYATANSKEKISLGEVNKLVTNGSYGAKSLDDLMSSDDFLDDYSKNIIKVDSTPYLIKGVGVTPDMAYPIIDEKHPTVNVKNQALIFVNEMGYKRIWDAYRTNPTEKYISIKFDDISKARKNEILQEIETISEDPSAAPALASATPTLQSKFSRNFYASGVKMATWYDDPDDQMTLTEERVGFLDDLQSTTKTISILTTTMLVIFVSLIVIMVFRVLVGSQRKSLATLLALGSSKTKIAMSTAVISLIIGAIPAIFGYVVGWGLQFPFINSFEDFWTIPTFTESFSLVSLLVVVILPTVAIFFLIWVITMVVLSKPITTMLSSDVHGGSNLVAKITHAFKVAGIKTKYGIALSVRNSGKLLVVAAATAIASIALMVGISTLGKGEKAFDDTMVATNFEYKVDLYSPTVEGGDYNRVYKDDDGKYYTSSNLYSEVESRDTFRQGSSYEVQTRLDTPHWHNATTGDVQYTDYSGLRIRNDVDEIRVASRYLENALQFKPFLDEKLLAGTVRPWETAKQLMPDNQRNNAITNQDEMNDLYRSELASHPQMDNAGIENIIDNVFTSRKLNQDGDVWNPYIISYGSLVTEKTDETYTYLDSEIHFSDGDEKYHISGIDRNSSMYNIDSSLDELVDYKGNNIPILINNYWEENYDLDVGDKLSSTVKNYADRTFNTNHPDVTYEIVGIIDTYNDADPITLMSIANDELGLSPGAFNGVMTTNPDSAFMSSLPLYSPSGMYFATDTITGAWESIVDTRIADIQSWPQLNPQYNNFSKAINNSDDFIKYYSSSPIVGALDKVVWNDMERQAFESVSDLSSMLINTIEAVSIALSVLFSIIVISLIVRTNRRRIATLWTLGYRKNEIVRIFSSSFLLPLLLSIAVAIPISMGVLAMLRTFIIDFGHILIPFSLTIWVPFIVAGIIGAIFMSSVMLSVLTLKQETALQAFKEE